MESYDLLNELTVSDKIRDVRIFGTVVGEVNFQSFVKESVHIGADTRFVELKTFAIFVDGAWKLLDGVIYATVSAEWVGKKIGSPILCEGTLSTINKKSSREVSLFKFAKQGDTWHILPVTVKKAIPSLLAGSIFHNPDIFVMARDYPLTLVAGFGYQSPLTAHYSSAFELDLTNDTDVSSDLNRNASSVFGEVPFLEPLQVKVLSEMTLLPIIQLKLNYGSKEISDILTSVKEQLDSDVKIYNLTHVQCDKNYLVDIVKRVRSEEEYEDTPIIFLVNYKREGIPYLELGRRLAL